MPNSKASTFVKPSSQIDGYSVLYGEPLRDAHSKQRDFLDIH